MKRHITRSAVCAILCGLPLVGTADNRDVYWEKGYPGARCKFAGTQSQDTFMPVSGVLLGITNTSTTTRTAVCPIVNDAAGAMRFQDGAIYVLGAVACTLRVREERGSSSASYSPTLTTTDAGTGSKRLGWCGSSCGGAAFSGPTTLNTGVSYVYVCSVPPGGAIHGYHLRTWVGP